MLRHVVKCVWILLLALGAPRAARAAAELDPALESALLGTPASTRVPVMIVMERQGLAAADRARLRSMDRRRRRAEGRSLLRSMAEYSQLDVRLFLARLGRAGEADSPARSS